MAVIADPIPLAAFQERFGLVNVEFDDVGRVQTMDTVGGPGVTAAYGEPLWTGSIQSQKLRLDSGVTKVEAPLSLIKQGRKFLIFPSHQPFPQSDRAGSVITATQDMRNIQNNNREVEFARLPANFELTEGDYFSYIVGGRYYFHKLLGDVTANGSGVTGPVEVFPYISQAVSGTVVCTFSKPTVRARIASGSGSGFQGVTGSGLNLSWVQAV